MKHFAFCLMLMFSFFIMASCQNSKKDRITELVKEWEGKEILFPKNSVFTIQGKDTVDFNFSDADYKIVTYVDSIGCLSCKLKLKEWKEFIQQIQELGKGKDVAFCFYFSPQNQRFLQLTLRRYNFIYPICIDTKGEFNKLNKISTEMDFQTFLIDSSNKILIGGNPVHNEKIKNLYLCVL